MRTVIRTPQEKAIASRLLKTSPKVIDKILAERSMSLFLKDVWPAIDPHEYVHGWHIDVISEHLEAVISGEILRLLINMPPRHAKSSSVSVGFPAWAWIKRPSIQFLFSSYASSLSIRDGIKCRRVLDSPLYKERWGDRFSLTSDQNTKIRFDNDKGGYRLSTSVDGMTTGEGGDIIVIDDPNNIKEAESDVMRNTTNSWFDEVMQTRLNNPKTGAIVVIQQRTHANDLSGHILKKYGDVYTHLKLPAEFEVSDKRVNAWKGWTDPRKEEGELLWPNHYGRTEIDRLKVALGVYASAGQLQQRPSPREGGIIPMQAFKRYAVKPARESLIRLVLSIDTAYKENEMNDYSVIEVWGEATNGHYLLYVWRKRAAYPELKRITKSYIEHYSPNEVLIEDKGSGTTLIQELRIETKKSIIAINPKNVSKDIRMEVESAAIEAGLVWLPEVAPWLPDFEEECSQFPVGAHDDQVDPMSQYLKRARERRQKGAQIVAPNIELSRESHWRGALNA